MTRPTTHGVGVRDEGYVFRGAVKRKCTYSGAITISDPKVKLPICKEEIAQGRAGVCTGYVIGTAQGMQARNEICIPLSAGYEDMVQGVVSWIEPALERASGVQRYMLFDTETALRNVWSCKK